MIEFTVTGTPAPQGSKKFVGRDKTGRGLLVESSSKVKPWRMDVKAVAEAMRAAHGVLRGGVLVSMIFTLPKPASAPKTRRTWPDKKPDLSKLARSTEDAISDAGLWEDDARIVEYGRLAKVFPGEDPDSLPTPGVVIRIELIERHHATPSPADKRHSLHGQGIRRVPLDLVALAAKSRSRRAR